MSYRVTYNNPEKRERDIHTCPCIMYIQTLERLKLTSLAKAPMTMLLSFCGPENSSVSLVPCSLDTRIYTDMNIHHHPEPERHTERERERVCVCV